jgi:hypothetical protein
MNHFPAIVGELVAEMRARAEDDRKHGEPDQLLEMWIETLSALTAEAGKGEEADICRIIDEQPFTAKNDARRVWQLFKDDVHVGDAIRAILALSTATPAGEWVLVPKSAFKEALDSIKVPKMSPLKQELFKAGTHAVIRAFNEVIAAASPRGASESGHE